MKKICSIIVIILIVVIPFSWLRGEYKKNISKELINDNFHEKNVVISKTEGFFPKTYVIYEVPLQKKDKIGKWLIKKGFLLYSSSNDLLIYENKEKIYFSQAIVSIITKDESMVVRIRTVSTIIEFLWFSVLFTCYVLQRIKSLTNR